MWETVAIILLPVLIPYVRSHYNALQRFRNVRSRSFTNSERRLVCYLALVVLLQLLLYLRLSWHPAPNIYRLTASRLVVPLDVLKRRLQQLSYSVPDELWTILNSRNGVLLYQRLGAKPLLDCAWCSTDEPNSFLFFSLGTIIFPYLLILAGLSVAVRGKALLVIALAIGLSLETYARSGGFDDYNVASTGSRDILYIDVLAEHVRQLYFLFLTLLVAANIYLEARFPRQVLDYESSRKHLSAVVERLRASNSLQRAICDDEGLRKHSNDFWLRNDAATRKLNDSEQLQVARNSARDRIGNEDFERKNAKSFLDSITVFDSSA